MSCSNSEDEITVDVSSHDQIITLQYQDTTAYIFSIFLSIESNIDDKAILEIKDGVNYTKEYNLDAGQIKLLINTDWYSPKCIINYKAIKANRGILKIKYKFFKSSKSSSNNPAS